MPWICDRAELGFPADLLLTLPLLKSGKNNKNRMKPSLLIPPAVLLGDCTLPVYIGFGEVGTSLSPRAVWI